MDASQGVSVAQGVRDASRCVDEAQGGLTTQKQGSGKDREMDTRVSEALRGEDDAREGLRVAAIVKKREEEDG